MPSPSIQMMDYISRHCLGRLTTPRYSWHSQAIALAPRFINLLRDLASCLLWHHDSRWAKGALPLSPFLRWQSASVVW